MYFLIELSIADNNARESDLGASVILDKTMLWLFVAKIYSVVQFLEQINSISLTKTQPGQE